MRLTSSSAFLRASSSARRLRCSSSALARASSSMARRLASSAARLRATSASRLASTRARARASFSSSVRVRSTMPRPPGAPGRTGPEERPGARCRAAAGSRARARRRPPLRRFRVRPAGADGAAAGFGGSGAGAGATGAGAAVAAGGAPGALHRLLDLDRYRARTPVRELLAHLRRVRLRRRARARFVERVSGLVVLFCSFCSVMSAVVLAPPRPVNRRRSIGTHANAPPRQKFVQ